jgi:hypothetical protein
MRQKGKEKIHSHLRELSEGEEERRMRVLEKCGFVERGHTIVEEEAQA